MLLSRMRERASPPPAAAEPTGLYRFVTIARDVGSEGDEVASGLAQRLQWHVFDKEIVDSIAEDSHVRQGLVRELDERSQGLVQDMVERLLHMAEGISFGNMEYHKALIKTLAYLAARGNAVIVGRGSAFALQGEPGLHLRVVASLETRVMRMAQRWEVKPEEAKRRMQQIDAGRHGFVQRHFGQNIDDPLFYDAIINTDRMSVEDAVRCLLGLIRQPGQIPQGLSPSGAHAAATNAGRGNPRLEQRL
jgi:cytidylate kinase